VPDFAPKLRRMLTLTTAVSMALPVLPPPALAQEAAPPARVGQIAAITGSVSFNGSGSGGWAAASLNYPVADGDSLYTQNNAQAAIALDASKITLAGNTELQITQLDENDFAATASQGEVFLAVNNLQPGQNFTIATPRGTASITQNGAYDFSAGDTSSPTVITVFRGAATITAPGATLNVPQGQAGVLSGTDQTTAQLGQAEPDSFASAMLAQAAPPPPPYVPPVAEQMTGTTELATYGSWDQDPQYGAIWYPRVNAGWAPYREGHWVFASPWGWTWVENEPWGFAPFHYGRWVDADNRWGWAPCPAYQGGDSGPDYRPVYAPAVVSFFGLGVAVGITAAALSSGRVGWVPLGPNEPYYPSYRASPDYIRRINIVNVRNINTVMVTNNYYGNAAPDHFANRRAATFIAASDMSRGAPVARYGKPVAASEFADARPITPGFAAHPAAGQPDFRLPGAAAPLAHEHPGFAPQPGAFADRRTIPPAVISHEPATHFAGPQAATFRPPAPGMAPNRPAFQANPGYGAPRFAEPSPGQPPARLPAASEAPRPGAPQLFHPQGEAQRPANPQVFHPQAEPARPAAPAYQQPQVQRPAQMFQPQPQPQRLPQVIEPQPAIQRPAQTFQQPPRLPQAEAPRPMAPQVFHPQAEAPRPQPPAFHPQAEAPRPQPPAFHPQAEAPRPAPPAFHPAAEAPRPLPDLHQTH
jgi:hypothetical protein